MNDPKSRVSALKQDERNYGVLAYLGTAPRTTYLGRVRNPNPAMPGAELIGHTSVFEEKSPGNEENGADKPAHRNLIMPSENPSLLPGEPPHAPLLLGEQRPEYARAREEMVREPYVLHGRNAAWVGDRIASVVQNPAPLWWWILVIISAIVASFAGIGILYLIVTGVGVWGENNSANWAWDITNFVFWIGIGHAGTMIAAILYLTRQKWASGINRAAEAMTIFAVMCAGIYPAIHVGRAWFAWYLAPIPNANGIWPNFRSPLLWDVFAVSTYLSVSIMFWYVGLIPDAAAMRDRVKNKIAKFFYAIICMGWRGSARQWVNYEFCYLMLAGIATLLVITTCTVVSSDFSTSVIPGSWHGTIFIPYFGVGAIYGGFCMLIILLVPIRQYYKMQEIITLRHIDMCCRFHAADGPVRDLHLRHGIFHCLLRRQPERTLHLL